MALTENFKELVQRRATADPAFGAALLRDGIDTMLAGDVETGKTILRDYIKATIGFEKAGETTGAPPKSLIHMFDPRGSPQARNLFGILCYLQQQAGIELYIKQEPGALRFGLTVSIIYFTLTAWTYFQRRRLICNPIGRVRCRGRRFRRLF